MQNRECDDTSSLKETTARGRPWDLCVDKVLPQCKTAIGHNKQMYVGGMYEGNLQVTILQFFNIDHNCGTVQYTLNIGNFNHPPLKKVFFVSNLFQKAFPNLQQFLDHRLDPPSFLNNDKNAILEASLKCIYGDCKNAIGHNIQMHKGQ